MIPEIGVFALILAFVVIRRSYDRFMAQTVAIDSECPILRDGPMYFYWYCLCGADALFFTR